MTSGWQRGNRLLVRGQYAQAVEEFLAHAAAVPREACRSLVQAAECLRRSNVLEQPVPVGPGVRLIHEGNRAAAEATYRRALAIEPGYFPALRGLAQVLEEDSAERLAVLEAAVAIRLDPLLVEQLGEIYERAGRVGDAHELYRRALDSDPNGQWAALVERTSTPGA